MGIRPIVSSCDSITEKISQFVDKWLQPYVKNLPSYVKDTTEFINQIEATQLPTNCKLASIDISSLLIHKHTTRRRSPKCSALLKN